MTFNLIDSRPLPDIQSVGHIYEHNKTGAQVIYLENEDANKAFNIAFKTPVENDNGIAHILEHAVLNGSEKYPSKEPFVELIKGSLNTFVNAMTFQNRTAYPISSTNQKDYMNLMSVYLDAVFAPNLRHDPQILEQEGWHYHLESIDDDLTYNGVVYNEMKGALASPDRQLYQLIDKTLYADTQYASESGGHPNAIPTLTQEEFIQFHTDYYHPSNSLTVLYGDLDLDQAFTLLDEYFDRFERREDTVDLTIELPTDVQPQQIEATYSITEGDDPLNKTYLALAWHLTTREDALLNKGLRALSAMLLGNNQAPLKRALLDANIGGDIEGSVDSSGYPQTFSIVAKYSSADKLDLFKEVVRTTLEDIVENGLDPELIEATLNRLKFSGKEQAISESNPRGVIYSLGIFSDAFFDADPFASLEFSRYLDTLTDLSKEGYFESLIEKYLLNNQHRLEVVLTAEPGKSAREEAKVLEELQAYKAQLSEEALTQIVQRTQALLLRQTTPDRPEDLAKIPMLQREDLSSEVESLTLDIQPLRNTTNVYFSEQFTSGIDYIDYYIDISDIPQDQYELLSLYVHFLGHLPTTNYSIERLRREIDLYTGGISTRLSFFQTKSREIKPFIVIHGKALTEQKEKLIALMNDIAFETQFDDIAEMTNLTQKLLSHYEDYINFSAHAMSIVRVNSHWSPVMKLEDQTSGVDHFMYTKGVLAQLRSNDPTILEQLVELRHLLSNKNRLNLAYIGDQAHCERIVSTVKETTASLPERPLGHPVEYMAGKKQNEAFITSQDVNYVGAGNDAAGILTLNGAHAVLATLIRLDYLWNAVRVIGGAYGAMFRFTRQSDLVFSSYRDPNIIETIKTYQALPDYIQQLQLDEDALLKTIIGTISPLEQPASSYAKGSKAINHHFSEITHAERTQLKEEILSTTLEELVTMSEAYQNVVSDLSLAVIGNKTLIEANSEQFDEIFDLY